MHLKVDMREMRKLERDLHSFKSRAMPYATRAYVNAQAFEAQKLWKQELPQKMTLRSKYTEQSIRVDKTQTLNISAQSSRVYSSAEYMDSQEYGAVETKKGKHGVPVPGKPLGRRRMPKAKQLRNIKLLPRISGHRSRQVAASLALAKKRGGVSFAYLKLKKRRGLYLLDPSKKRAAVRKVWDLSRPSVTIPKNPTMAPAVQQLARIRTRLWRDALLYQLRRHKILGY